MDPELFFYKVSLNYPRARKRFEGIDESKEIDGIYRIYHHSFKMYHELQGSISEYLDVLFDIVDLPTDNMKYDWHTNIFFKSQIYYPNIESKLDELKVYEFFECSILDAFGLIWKSNEHDVWYEDQTKLASGIQHAKVGINSIMEVARRYHNEDILPGEDSYELDEHDVLCEHILDFPRSCWQNLRERLK